jgi:hypothetical protein
MSLEPPNDVRRAQCGGRKVTAAKPIDAEPTFTQESLERIAQHKFGDQPSTDANLARALLAANEEVARLMREGKEVWSDYEAQRKALAAVTKERDEALRDAQNWRTLAEKGAFNHWVQSSDAYYSALGYADRERKAAEARVAALEAALK